MVDEFLGPRGCFITGFLTALRTDPELSDAFRVSTLADLRTPLRGAIARDLGDDQPDLDLRADLAPAILAFPRSRRRMSASRYSIAREPIAT
jgi:hypothetical protein